MNNDMFIVIYIYMIDKKRKRILSLLIKNIILKKQRRELIEHNQQLFNELNYKQYDINMLMNRNAKLKRENDGIYKFNKDVNMLIKCPVCQTPALIHRVYSTTGVCNICKDDIIDIYSTTCGHAYCKDCSDHLLNHYKFIH